MAQPSFRQAVTFALVLCGIAGLIALVASAFDAIGNHPWLLLPVLLIVIALLAAIGRASLIRLK